MSAVWTTVAVCLLAGIAPLACAIQVTVVCADLVGAGGVGVRVWPTLKASPERYSNTQLFRMLQVNWEAERLLEGDWIGVFEEDPRPPYLRPPTTQLPSKTNRDWTAPQPLFWDTPFATHGTITSNYTQPRVKLSVLARGGCVGPFVGFVRNGVCIVAECLASHPTWLYDHRAVLGNRSIRSLVLPGTHNSGSYSILDDNDVVASWVVCQDEDIISQLLYGNRYLDLRVGYYPDTEELLWVNHNLVRWRPLQGVLDDVRGFLALSPDPLIIDIHRTPVGFQLSESLELLLSLVNASLGSYLIHNRYGPQVTLDDLWQTGKRVIFTFIEPSVSQHTPWVWPPVPQAWANAQLLDDLRTFLDTEMNNRFESPRLWAAMAHLTPTLWDLLFRADLGVRGLSDRVNFSITRWLRQRWGYMANIVASDFFRGNDIINVAIRTNLALSMCRPSYPSRNPYTLRWTADLALRSGFPSTTIPPFFRRIYPTGPLWNTTSVRHVQYPSSPVEANISMVYTVIPNRIPSIVPGVIYQNDNMWRDKYNPLHLSPQPSNVITPQPNANSPITTTLSTLDSSTTETVMPEWSNVKVDGILEDTFLSEVFASTPESISGLPDLPEGKAQNHYSLPREVTTDSGLWQREGDAADHVLQDDGITRVTAAQPFLQEPGNSESNYDTIRNANLTHPTNNTTLLTDQTITFEHGSFPTVGNNIEEEFSTDTLVTSNNHHNNYPLSPLDNDTSDDYLLSTNNEGVNHSLPTMINDDGYPSSPFDTANESSSIPPINNLVHNDSYLIHNNTEHFEDNVPFVSPTLGMLFEKNGGDQSTGSEFTNIRHFEGADLDTGLINDANTSGTLDIPHHQTHGNSTNPRHVSRPLKEQIRSTSIHSNIPKVHPLTDHIVIKTGT